MPRRPARPTAWQENFRLSLIREQQRQGMTDAGLAERASQFYPISASAVWKIKNATPPRKVDLDEAMALSRVLGFQSIDEFVRGVNLVAVLDDATRSIESTLFNAMAEMLELESKAVDAIHERTGTPGPVLRDWSHTVSDSLTNGRVSDEDLLAIADLLSEHARPLGPLSLREHLGAYEANIATVEAAIRDHLKRR
jgi:hypothetical protein